MSSAVLPLVRRALKQLGFGKEVINLANKALAACSYSTDIDSSYTKLTVLIVPDSVMLTWLCVRAELTVSCLIVIYAGC